MNIDLIIQKIQDMHFEMQSIIGTDEETQNDFADGYKTAIDDVIELLKNM